MDIFFAGKQGRFVPFRVMDTIRIPTVFPLLLFFGDGGFECTKNKPANKITNINHNNRGYNIC